MEDRSSANPLPVEESSLLGLLKEQIQKDGPITFASFMQEALYHPRLGYYANQVPGHGVHYATSPSITPWFGRLVARELGRMWNALGQPDPFTVVEVGGGMADLAAGAMEAAGPLSGALRWRFIELFPSIRDLQRKRLGRRSAQVEWATELDELPPVVGCVLANEVLDNFPVHVLQKAGKQQLREVYVALDGDQLVEQLGPLSNPALAEPAQRASAYLGEGDRCEVCLGLRAWCRQAASSLERGYLVIVDYGDEEPEIWQHGQGGTIATYGPAGSGRPALEEPGRQDITADTNFSALASAARQAGFDPKPIFNQGPWLLSLGLAQVAHHLYRSAKQADQWGWHENSVGLMGERSRVLKLAAEGGLGEALVFMASKDAPLPWIQEQPQGES